MIKPQPISGFPENLPERQILEDNFKEIIKKNYSLSGFTPLDTPVVERLETLTSKGGDDNEIYGIHRISGEIPHPTPLLSEGEEIVSDDSRLGLRFDLTVPLARYIAQYEGELTFPFRRQHIARVYRGERPQKGRFRELYQADVDIIGNGELPFSADCETISTIFGTLKELNFGDFVININNKKFLSGFLESIGIDNTLPQGGDGGVVLTSPIGRGLGEGSERQGGVRETISIIDKKEKVKKDKLTEMFKEIELTNTQIEAIFEFIKFGEDNTNEKILSHFSQIDNKLLKEGINELKEVYNWLLDVGIGEKYLKINPSISRGLNYYTGIVFETFIVGAENLGSIASGGRYENLASNFSKNNYPGVGGSIGLSRLLAVLESLGKIKPNRKTISKVLVLNMGKKTLKNNLKIVETLRKSGINTEIYLEEAKMQKQLKYANSKKIPFAIICGDEELEKKIIQLKNLDTGKQEEVKESELVEKIKD